MDNHSNDEPERVGKFPLAHNQPIIGLKSEADLGCDPNVNTSAWLDCEIGLRIVSAKTAVKTRPTREHLHEGDEHRHGPLGEYELRTNHEVIQLGA